MPHSVSLILPAYNEAHSIAATISEAIRYFRAKQFAYEIIVAADGDDGTREVVREIALSDARVQVIGGPERRGKGRGIREAMCLARHAVVGYADADNKVPIEEYDKFAPLLEEGCPIVIGSRALAQSQIERAQPWYRRAGAALFAVTMSTVTGLRAISDTQCGFKFFRHDVGRQLFEIQKIDGYMFDVEILLLAERLGLPVREIPIRWRDDADSRLELLLGSVRNMRELWQIRRETRAARERRTEASPARVTSQG